MLHPGDYPSQFYDEDDDERDVNSAVKTALTALGKVHSFTQDALTVNPQLHVFTSVQIDI